MYTYKTTLELDSIQADHACDIQTAAAQTALDCQGSSDSCDKLAHFCKSSRTCSHMRLLCAEVDTMHLQVTILPDQCQEAATHTKQLVKGTMSDVSCNQEHLPSSMLHQVGTK